MLTDKVYVNNKGAGREKALGEVERYAGYCKLDNKKTLHVRLLAEELLGMVAEIGGDFDAEFWIDGTEEGCRICLEAETEMNAQKREELLKASTSGKNAAAKGIMGKLKNVMELYWLGYKDVVEGAADYTLAEYTTMVMITMASPRPMVDWKLSDYIEEVEDGKDSDRSEDWDELEKSIVANLADDVSVAIKGGTVEFVITKSFS